MIMGSVLDFDIVGRLFNQNHEEDEEEEDEEDDEEGEEEEDEDEEEDDKEDEDEEWVRWVFVEQEGGRENVNRTPPLPYFPSSLLLSTQICLGDLPSSAT